MGFEYLPKRTFSLIAFLSLINFGYLYEFDKDYVGVVFSPHGKLLEHGNYPPWNNYSFQEVQDLLSVVSTRFSNISTYGMGVTKVDAKSWDEGEAVGMTGMAAARLNEQHNKTLIRACLGVWHHDDLKLNAEIRMAVKVAREANEIHEGTVWGITLTSNYIDNLSKAQRVLDLITFTRNLTEFYGESIQIGTRINNCEKLTHVNGNVSFLNDVMKNVDYVLCSKMPLAWAAKASVKYAIENNLDDTFKQTKIAMRRINPDISVIFETGWPSQGISNIGLPTTIDNLRDYWEEMGTWAKTNKFPIHMFEALDQPWKANMDIFIDQFKKTRDRESPFGVCGSEAHFGWWRRTDNYKADATVYVEKITEPQRPACDEIGAAFATSLVLGLSLAIILLISIVLFLYWRLRTTKKELLLTEKEIEEFEKGIGEFDEGSEHTDLALLLPCDRKFELGKDKFNIDRNRVLGSGQFGIVFKGKIEGQNHSVAFKTTKPRCPAQNFKSLLAEIKLMIYIGTHPNIVCLLGAYTGEIREGGVYIASEYCAFGSLEKLLQSISENMVQDGYDNSVSEKSIYANKEVQFERYVNTPAPITVLRPDSILDASVILYKLPNLIKWAHQIANGMTHLVSKKVIHADLAARNVLITGNGIAKITDFGLSRKLYTYTEYVKQNEEPLSWRWMSIESLKKLSFSSESDVWSYGVVLWEIFSLGDVPYPGLGWEVGFVDKLISGLRLQKPKHASDDIYEKMVNCWKPEPKDRPSFDELASFFKELS